MQLLLVSKSKKKSISIAFSSTMICILCAVFLVNIAIVFYLGGAYSLSRANASSNESGIALIWKQEIKKQRLIVTAAREDAEKNLNALAVRLSKLQAHMMRLDALGSRLAQMAKLDEIEFGVNASLGLGGPNLNEPKKSITVSNFLNHLDELYANLNDREEKLVAMESILIDRTLREQTLPAGKPTVSGWVSSLFGMRADPITGKMEFHGGIDYAGKEGSPVYTVGSGIVTWSGDRYGYGNLVEINHGNGYRTRYAHNKKNLVSIGQKVNKGQKIALMGSTGRSTGPHVHFEVINNGKVVNPSKYISLE